MPTITVSEDKIIIPSSILHLKNGDTLDISKNQDKTFTLKPRIQPEQTRSFMEILEQIKQQNQSIFNSTQEIDDFIRKERDLWD